MIFDTMEALRTACRDLPAGDDAAADAVMARQKTLTKPLGSLGRLEELAAWLARWQRRAMPSLDRVEILIFAGNHGVVARGVSPYPASVTAQMVHNFSVGGAAINQLARLADATLRVVPLRLEEPTGDIAEADAMDEPAFLDAVDAGYRAVTPGTDLLALGEMGIGNTTVAAALAAALFGGDGGLWVGRGSGLDASGMARKRAAVDAALKRQRSADPLDLARCLGGRETAAVFGATLAARLLGIPIVLDGFICTAAAAPLATMAAGGLDHAMIAHKSHEAGHAGLADALDMVPLLDLGMRLGEASGAAMAIPVLRAAVACHAGMATFREAGVSDRE